MDGCDENKNKEGTEYFVSYFPGLVSSCKENVCLKVCSTCLVKFMKRNIDKVRMKWSLW